MPSKNTSDPIPKYVRIYSSVGQYIFFRGFGPTKNIFITFWKCFCIYSDFFPMLSISARECSSTEKKILPFQKKLVMFFQIHRYVFPETLRTFFSHVSQFRYISDYQRNHVNLEYILTFTI